MTPLHKKLKKDLTIRHIKICEISLDELQPRGAKERMRIADIKKDLEKRGQIYPIIVGKKVNGKYPLYDGERRIHAHEACGITVIEAIICSPDSLLAAYELQFASNMKRNTISLDEMVGSVTRYKKAYLEKNPAATKAQMEQVLRELTGCGEGYFESVNDIIEARPDLKRAILVGVNVGGKRVKQGNYTNTEIKNACPDKHTQNGVIDAYLHAAKQGKPLGATRVRAIHDELRNIDPALTPTNRRVVARGAMLRVAGFQDNTVGNAVVYKNRIRQWQSEIEDWSANGVSLEDQQDVSRCLENLVEVWRAKRERTHGPLPKASHPRRS